MGGTKCIACLALSDAALEPHLISYPDGSHPKLLDLIDLPVARERPHRVHTENLAVDRLRY